MLWKSLNLWGEEEKRIHQCLTESLQELSNQHTVKSTDDEKTITGKLRPVLKSIRKHRGLEWSIQFEASSFEKDVDADPTGHPDIRLTRLDKDKNQYDYDIECKLIRVKRIGKTMDYCSHYVNNGVIRYQSGKYAQSSPQMGTMLGYVQEGDFLILFNTINEKVKQQGLGAIQLEGAVVNKGVTKLSQRLKSSHSHFVLYHLWADLR